MLLGFLVAVAVLFINLAVPHRVRLIGVALLMVPQLYVPGFPPSVAVLWTLFTCVAGLTARGRSRADSPLVVIALLFAAVTAVSLSWAVPGGSYVGVVFLSFSLLFVLWLREVIVLARDDSALLDTIVIWSVPGVVLQSILEVVFRISPEIERLFLQSALGPIIVGPAAKQLFIDMPNNILDPAKSGGFFVNGNNASLFTAVSGLVMCVAARRTGRSVLYAPAGIAFVGSLFTGSKTFLLIGLCCVIIVIFLPRILEVSSFSLFLGMLLPSLVVLLALNDAPGFPKEYEASFDTRQQLWARASEVIQESPFLGLGFGGWIERVGIIGSAKALPPHNYLIAAWVNSGILAVVMATVFVLAVAVFGLRVAAAQDSIEDRRTAVFAFCATFWTFVHGMGDNTPMYGERMTMILFAVAIGYLYAMPPAGETEDGK